MTYTQTHHPDTDALQARFALRVAARLSEHSDALAHDLSERLRVAREQAVTRARIQRRAAASGQVAGSLGSRLAWLRSPWGLRLAGTVPFAVTRSRACCT